MFELKRIKHDVIFICKSQYKNKRMDISQKKRELLLIKVNK
jgi:hypothetical protein